MLVYLIVWGIVMVGSFVAAIVLKNRVNWNSDSLMNLGIGAMFAFFSVFANVSFGWQLIVFIVATILFTIVMLALDLANE